MIHLAWEGLPNFKEEFHVKENLPRHNAFLNNLIQHGLRDLTVTGTCFEYGMKDGCLQEDMECEPANPYAIAKHSLHLQLESLREQIPFECKWVRLFYMYGQGQSPKSLISQLDKALENDEREFKMSGGEQVRDFLPVEKVAENIVAIALQQKLTGVINCCSGNPITVKDFVENYLKERNKHISLHLGFYPYADYEAMRFWGDATKLRSVTNNK
jgi:dTDP-6-deoxy-L-talose 4-dehydrogenase (NAD+)